MEGSLENGYPLKLIFEKINHRLKTLIYNKYNYKYNPLTNLTRILILQ